MLRRGGTVIYLFLSLLALPLFAKAPAQWNTITSVSEQHEFYKNLEPIVKPKDSWQHIFSLNYLDSDLNAFKDCVFYRVPGADPGALKIKTLSTSEKCDPFLLEKGDLEIQNLKLLQYAIFENKLTLDINYSDLKTEKWVASIQGAFKRPAPRPHLSSSEYKAPKIVFLAPKKTVQNYRQKPFQKDGTLCLNVNEDCEVLGSSTCEQCEEGWYEVPNGCSIGPKYCGRGNCGGKDQPACRRGMKWQRKEETFECRMDSSFAYCSKGLTVQCDGKKAFCR